MASASISRPRISLRGRKFRIIEGGEEIRRPSDELLCVILAVEPGSGLMQKTFYNKGYVSGDSSPPDCSSANGVNPDPWVSNPVSNACRTCPKNVFGSATNAQGKKTKACKDSKCLWVALPEALDGTVFALGVPVTSLKAMAEYGSMLKSNGIPVAAVLTRLTMADSEYPELVFEFAGVLEEGSLEVAMERNEKRNWNITASGPLLEHNPTPAGPIQAPGADRLLGNQAGSGLTPDDEALATSKQMSADEATGHW
jgi:hypothetical protein